MTARTRRFVFLSVLVVALTLPVEAVLLLAVQSTDTTTDAQLWASSLDRSALASAADQIEQYPFVYRRAIMTDLSPAARAAVWQAHIKRYAAAHPEFDATVRNTLAAAEAAATPEAVSAPTDATRASTHAVADQVAALLGKDQMLYLFYWLGPQDTTVSESAVPLRFRLATYVRDHFALMARSDDCDCEVSVGCYGLGDVCVSNSVQNCNIVQQWPACGLWWADVCDGHCTSGY